MAAISVLAVLIPQGVLVFRVLPIFGLGWVTAHRALRPQPVHALAIAWLLVLLFRVAGLEQAVVAAVCVGLLNVALAYPSFGPGPLLWLGGISYSLFLIHVPLGGRIVNLISRWPLSPLSQLLVCLLALVASVLMAWGFCVLIETPSQRWSRR